MNGVYVRGFITVEKRNAALDKPNTELLRGTPQNGYVFGRFCKTLYELNRAVRDAKNRNVFLNFLLEDNAGTTKPTTDVTEARQHLANS